MSNVTTMRFLIFGDVSGRPGRDAITSVLPDFREQYKPDSIIINIENIAHGKGISPDTMKEALTWKADVFTSGDHAWDNEAGIALLDDKTLPIIRPANYPPNVPGRGWHTFQIGAYSVTVINLQGQLFFRNDPLSPFAVLDDLLKESPIASSDVVLVDFHADATSEKRAMGWYVDGRVAALFGTHTHVPTADAQVLPSGTGYISDIGMNGAYHSILGVETKGSLQLFLTQIKHKLEPPSEAGPLEVNALLLDVDPKTQSTAARTTHIAQIRKIINDKK